MQEVLGEIQRLKDEANRFIAILSAEDDSSDENLSPAKKQTLTREVESLQVTLANLNKLSIDKNTQVIHTTCCFHSLVFH